MAADVAGSGLPVVVLVGRPNVGKSALFNRVVGARRAIVDDAPGVTRDRLVAPASHAGRTFLCVDTGGFLAEPPRDPATLAARVRAQTLTAIQGADCVVCVFDGQSGLGPADRGTIDVLRRSGKPAIFVVQKIDTPRHEALVSEFYAAGPDRLLPVSAAHNRGVAALLDAVVATLPPAGEATAGAGQGTRLALVGRPNVGKSSLLNRLLGAERTIVAPEPGTTRDAIDSPFSVGGRAYVLIDTAGIRRRGHIDEGIEKFALLRTVRAIERADAAILITDATEGITAQDSHIAGYALEAYIGLVLAVNKWDLVARSPETTAAVESEIGREFQFAPWMDHRLVSAKTGRGVEDTLNAAVAVVDERKKRIPTAELHRLLTEAVAAHPPPSDRNGKEVRFHHVTQAKGPAPTFVFFVDRPAAVHFSYTRYLENRIRERYDFHGTPIKIELRGARE